jgi:hypothetical protein
MVWFCIDPIFLPPFIRLIKPLLMQASDYLPTDSYQILHCTNFRMERACARAIIRAYFADFAAFITFCDLNNQSALPANTAINAIFSCHI